MPPKFLAFAFEFPWRPFEVPGKAFETPGNEFETPWMEFEIAGKAFEKVWDSFETAAKAFEIRWEPFHFLTNRFLSPAIVPELQTFDLKPFGACPPERGFNIDLEQLAYLHDVVVVQVKNIVAACKRV